jgi:integrase
MRRADVDAWVAGGAPAIDALVTDGVMRSRPPRLRRPGPPRRLVRRWGSILQRAVEGERIARNPSRIVRKVKRGPRREVRPLAPVTVEKLRAASRERDAMLISVLAYAGLRPQEALALCWGNVRDRTILVERAVSLGEPKDTKTRAHRTVRLLAPLQEDLQACGVRRARSSTACWCSRRRRAAYGRRRTGTTGAAERSMRRVWRSRCTTPGRMTCVTASRRCCCTRAAR